MTLEEFKALKPGDVICRLRWIWMIVDEIRYDSGETNLYCVVLYRDGLPPDDPDFDYWTAATFHTINYRYYDRYEKVYVNL